MKTISMSLEEYEREINNLKYKNNIQSYTKGALDMVRVLRDRLILRQSVSGFFNNEEATKALEILIKDIEREMIQRSIPIKKN